MSSTQVYLTFTLEAQKNLHSRNGHSTHQKKHSPGHREKKKVRLKEQKIANLARARSTENHIYNGKSGWQAEALHEAF